MPLYQCSAVKSIRRLSNELRKADKKRAMLQPQQYQS
jgi:hypothetical protein